MVANMCGIAGVHIKDDKYFENPERYLPFLEKFCNELLLGIENRGKHATGFAAVSRDGKKVTVDKDKINASQFIGSRKKFPQDTRTVLLHTRFATQGEPEQNENNHPVVYGTTFLTHNGMISNDDSIFRDEDLPRYAEVDTEAIAALIQKYGWSGVKEALPKLHGGYAIAAVNPTDEPGKLILAKGNTYPLVYHENKQFVVWASEASAIKRAWAAVLSKEGAENIETKWLGTGDIIWVEGESVSLETNAFKPHTGWGSTGSNYGGCGTSYWDWDDGDYEEPAWETSLKTKGSRYTKRGTFTTLDLKRPVAAKRAAGDGLCATFEDRDKSKLGIKWTRCSHCDTMVNDDDLEDSLAWDKICTDCKWFAVNHRFSNTRTKLSEEERDDLEGWADTDWGVHKYAIETTSYVTGLMPNAVEWLLHHATDEYLKKNKKLAQLKEELKVVFDEAEGEGWAAAFSDDDEDEKKGKEESEDKLIEHDIGSKNKIVHFDSDEGKASCTVCTPREKVTTWKCGCGKEHPLNTTKCPDDVEPEAEALEHLVDIDLENNDWRFAQCMWATCSKAGQVTHTNGNRYCVKHLAQRAAAEKRAEEEKQLKEKELTKCGFKKCRRKAKHFMGTAFRFCDAHFKKCASAKCKGKPVATLGTNARLCHQHARNLKGVYFDNDSHALKRAEGLYPVRLH